LKKKIFILFFIFLFYKSFSQDGYFYSSKKKPDKYFIAIGYGFGTAHWKSVFKSTEFYAKDGAVINTGDFKFSANSPTRNYDVNVLAPINRIRLGMGIDFEFHYLAQLKIHSKEGEEYLLFEEGLRFDKIYLQLEVPLELDVNKRCSLNLNLKLGTLGFTNVKRYNFLGDTPFPFSYHMASGVVADYRIYSKIYFYLYPSLEYKFFHNSSSKTTVEIKHNIFSACLQAGIRFNLGMQDD
jgi:hypothetical protein